MSRENSVGSVRVQRWSPILAGVGVAFLTGLLGLFTTSALASGNPVGGLVGAVGCGVTVAYLSEESFSTTVLYAAVADVVSSVLFFWLVLVVYLVTIVVSQGLALAFFASAFVTPYYLVFGGIFAVVFGTISVGIAVVSATLTVVVTRTARGFIRLLTRE